MTKFDGDFQTRETEQVKDFRCLIYGVTPVKMSDQIVDHLSDNKEHDSIVIQGLLSHPLFLIWVTPSSSPSSLLLSLSLALSFFFFIGFALFNYIQYQATALVGWVWAEITFSTASADIPSHTHTYTHFALLSLQYTSSPRAWLL